MDSPGLPPARRGPVLSPHIDRGATRAHGVPEHQALAAFSVGWILLPYGCTSWCVGKVHYMTQPWYGLVGKVIDSTLL